MTICIPEWYFKLLVSKILMWLDFLKTMDACQTYQDVLTVKIETIVGLRNF